MSFHNTKPLIKTEYKDWCVYDNNAWYLGHVDHHRNIYRTTIRSYFGKESTQEMLAKQTSFSHKALLMSTSAEHNHATTHAFYLCDCMEPRIIQKYTRNVKHTHLYSKCWSINKPNIILTHAHTYLHSSSIRVTNHTRSQPHKRTQTHKEDPQKSRYTVFLVRGHVSRRNSDWFAHVERILSMYVYFTSMVMHASDSCYVTTSISSTIRPVHNASFLTPGPVSQGSWGESIAHVSADRVR